MGPNTPNSHTISSGRTSGNTPALGAGYSAGGVLSRVVISLLLVPLFVALLVDAWRESGVAAPVVGR